MKHSWLTALFLLGACAVVEPTGPQVPPVPLPDQDTCGARQYQDLVGQDATALERVLIMRQVRIIRPTDAVTMDFRQDRINFRVDSLNRIVSIGCY